MSLNQRAVPAECREPATRFQAVSGPSRALEELPTGQLEGHDVQVFAPRLRAAPRPKTEWPLAY